MAELDKFLKVVVERKCSDLHVAAGMPMMVRYLGEMTPLTNQAVSAEQSKQLIYEILSEEQQRQFEETWELDAVYSLPSGERYRVNVCREQKGLAAVFRYILAEPKSFEELGLPPVIEKFVLATQGLIVVTGPGRSGKTATLASMIDHINTNRNEHIITIEDPIEYLHQSKKSIVSQRSVGPHSKSFSNALRAALREDPDVIMIGEIRDLETMSLALTAAETGHLVLATLHTSGAASTINRVINIYPPSEQAQAQTTLSECLIGVLSQELIKQADATDMVAAFEVLVNTLAVGNVIREGETYKLESMIEVGSKDGMKIMGASLTELQRAGKITPEAKQEFSPRKESG